VGLATARAILECTPARSVVILEKEATVAAHQSGRNSGVIHAGVYYEPGSAKARLCRAGRESMVAYCKERGISHEVCGKVVVATNAEERARLDDLYKRCQANGVRAEIIDSAGLRDIEPHASGVAALHVFDTGVVDYADVCRTLAGDITRAGSAIRLGWAVTGAKETANGIVIATDHESIEAQRVVTCAGLHADAVARVISGADALSDVRVVAFRGEYRQLIDSRAHLVRALIYPVADPDLPFLGVHLTRGIDGHVHVGPNAVLALAREGYRWRTFDSKHLRATVGFAGFRKFARHHLRFGIDEMTRSLSKRRFTKAVRRLVPEIQRGDLVAAPSGVRAQAVTRDGTLVDDFLIRSIGRAVHVLNAPSPAATASLEIGKEIAARITD
jgi:L-2-hydroxyglutarate oxidase